MTLGNVQRIEYGKAKSIPLDTLENICCVLECEAGDILKVEKTKVSAWVMGDGYVGDSEDIEQRA